jgi:hypothetical protein
MDQTFYHGIFSENTRVGEEEANGGRNKAQKRAHLLTAWWGLSRALSVVSMQSWTPRTWFDLKPTINTPSGDFMMGRQRNAKHTKWI